jgi:hypothetical protein
MSALPLFPSLYSTLLYLLALTHVVSFHIRIRIVTIRPRSLASTFISFSVSFRFISIRTIHA